MSGDQGEAAIGLLGETALTETKHSSGCPTISSASSQTFTDNYNIFYDFTAFQRLYKLWTVSSQFLSIKLN